ncbi:MAG TPA: ribonuclease E/G [Dongiaceae bacterium]|jgi:Ribonuclease G/E|nr:ribonuclease E/G [Dongiaceae bacterium]
MRHRIFIAGGEGGLDIFRWSDGRLAQAIREMPATRSQIGAVYLGRVERIEQSLNAAFVEIGLGRPGLLPLKKQGQQPTEGAAIPVQVRRDEREGKAVRLSASIHSETAFDAQLAQAKAQGRMPACLVPPPSAWQNCLAALDPAEIEEVICDRRVDVGAVQRWCVQHAAELSGRVRHVPLRDWQPERAEVDEEIAAALEETVTLPCGGNLLVEPVRTLTAIDVNSAAATRKAGMELTALTVNLEAAREVPRQLALRNLGGVVVIDFIDLENRNKREQVLQALRDAAAIDPAIEWVGNMSRLGLVEILRRRRGPTLAEMWGGEKRDV